MNVLTLHYSADTLLRPAAHESQELALQHFSSGSCVITFARLDEIVFIAGLHGWSVEVINDPREVGV